MRKVLFQLFLLLLILAGAGCAAKSGGAAAPGFVLKKDSFWVVFDRNLTPEDARKASASGRLEGQKIAFRLPEEQTIDLKYLCKEFIPVKGAAVVSFVVTASSDGFCRLGVGADNWYTCCFDGRIISTTEPKGIAPGTPTYLNKGAKVRLKKGDNRFFVHTRPGRATWIFSCGLLPDLDNWPRDPADRLTLFRNAFPQKDAMLGPFVSCVSTDRAVVSFEYSRGIAAALHYREAGSAEAEKILDLPPVYGRIPQKKIYRFELDGLLPGRKYEFKIFDREKFSGPVASGHFSTLPAAGCSHVLTAISDTQTLAFDRKRVIRDFARRGVFSDTDLLVSLGDVSSKFHDFNQVYFETFLLPFRQAGVTAPFYPVRGNHEYQGRETDKYAAFFGRPYYAFRYGDVLYIVLDTGEDKDTVPEEDHYTLLTDTAQYFREQKAWLEKLVESDMCKTAKKRIVLAHATPFEWQSDYYYGNIRYFASVFFGKKPRCAIDLWLCGDVHSPFRFDPVTRELAGAKRVPTEKHPCRLTENDEKNIHFPVYVNDGPYGAGQNFSVTRVAVRPDRLELLCMGEDGTVMDEIVIRRGRPFEVKKSIYKKYTPYKN
ncbi:MAG: metallophosphoesterase [Lentisphaeria bacterium]|nr:metallophosphoesterase [Lentisphaeria bacterium]